MRRNSSKFILIIIGFALSTMACDEDEPSDVAEDDHLRAGTDQSFLAPEAWAHELTLKYAWREHPRMLADTDADGDQDIVGFGDDGVWLATSTGSSFDPQFVLDEFGTHQDWNNVHHVRTVGDINNDGRADVVGFGDAGVYRALAENGSFGQPEFVLPYFGTEHDWSAQDDVRLLADVNADGSQDIVGFEQEGVWLSLAKGDGYFEEPKFVIADLGSQQGWDVDLHIRTTADVNGDDMQDIVGFGDHGVWLALSNGVGFQAPELVVQDFGVHAGGWMYWKHKRVLADVNNDGRDDIVGFGEKYVWLALSNGTGFDPMVAVTSEFVGWGYESRYPRFVTDLNADGFVDLLGLGPDGVTRALGGPSGFGPARTVLRAMTVGKGWSTSSYYPRMIGDVDGNKMTDLVGFDYDHVAVALSTDLPPGGPPAAPSNLQVIDATDHSLTISWKDNSDDELRFLVDYHPSGGPTRRTSTGPNTTQLTVSFLEPDTEYCFQVRAENLWDASAPTSTVCGQTKEQIEEPPNPPPPYGIRQVDVYNCHSDERAVHVWTMDLSQGFWTERGTAPSLWQGNGCPGNAAPFTVSLADGHYYWFVVVDPDLLGCNGQNNPEVSLCQRSIYGAPLRGLTDGPVLVNVVN